jgi:hypothetical protein
MTSSCYLLRFTPARDRPPSGYFFTGEVASAKGVDKEIAATKCPVPVREVQLDMTIDEFLKLFKIFSVTLQPDGINIKGKDFVTQD